MSGRARAQGALLLLVLTRRSVGRTRTEEQRLPVGQREVAAVGAKRSVLGLITVYQDLGPRLERISRETAAQQSVRSPGFDHPLFDAAIVLLDIQMHPSVGIDPFHLCNSPPQLDRS